MNTTTSKSDTPITDVAELRASDAGHPGYAHASTARTLERENVELRADVDSLRAQFSMDTARISEMQTEGHKLEAEVEALTTALQQSDSENAATLLDAVKTEEERNALKREVEKLEAALFRIAEEQGLASLDHQKIARNALAAKGAK
jgi:predicted  nucleic acid-binding Zn-ribbon protein